MNRYVYGYSSLCDPLVKLPIFHACKKDRFNTIKCLIEEYNSPTGIIYIDYTRQFDYKTYEYKPITQIKIKAFSSINIVKNKEIKKYLRHVNEKASDRVNQRYCVAWKGSRFNLLDWDKFTMLDLMKIDVFQHINMADEFSKQLNL